MQTMQLHNALICPSAPVSTLAVWQGRGGQPANSVSAFPVIPLLLLHPFLPHLVCTCTSSLSLYECEREKITLARFSWGFFPFPFPPDFHRLVLRRQPFARGRRRRERERNSLQYVTGVGGGAVTAKANPDSRSPRPLARSRVRHAKDLLPHRARKSPLQYCSTQEGRQNRSRQEFVSAPSLGGVSDREGG